MKKKLNQEELINQNIKIEELETSNRILLEKLKLLKIQLESQSQLHASAFHLHKSAPTHRSQLNLSHRNYNGFHSKDTKLDTAMNKQYESLFQQLHLLQEELENVKKQNKNRIVELEEQLKAQDPISPNKLKTELNDNVELIKLKRSTKKQTALIQSLQSQLEIANSEIKQVQANLASVGSKNETLQAELSQEKLENTKLQSNIETLKDTNKFLEEQLNDLQTEKNTLKEHNENLLKLSLQKNTNTGISDSRANYLKQIKELEDNLKKEVIAKSEALTKLADAEILNVKLQNELSKSNATSTEFKVHNSMLKEQVEELKEKLDSAHFKMIRQHTPVSTEDKAVMVTIADNADVVCSKNTLEDLSNIADLQDGADSMRMQLYKISSELNQCKELLRVQYALNNKYKVEIEELQKIFQKNEKTVTDCSRSLRNILRKHEDRICQLEDKELVETGLKSILDELHNLAKFKKSNYQDCINALDKLLNVLVGDLKSKMNLKSYDKVDIGVSVFVQSIDKIIQTDSSSGEVTKVEQPESRLEKGLAMFELQFGKATFTYFSEHLTKSTENNPKIFLTWNFMDDNEHQAYTPTISVNDGIFNCSCQYEGPWSEALHEYLNKHGINIEIHLVQGDISVRLAESRIDTSTCIRTPNSHQQFITHFENDNIKGNVVGNYKLSCDFDVLKVNKS